MLCTHKKKKFIRKRKLAQVKEPSEKEEGVSEPIRRIKIGILKLFQFKTESKKKLFRHRFDVLRIFYKKQRAATLATPIEYFKLYIAAESAKNKSFLHFLKRSRLSLRVFSSFVVLVVVYSQKPSRPFGNRQNALNILSCHIQHHHHRHPNGCRVI